MKTSRLQVLTTPVFRDWLRKEAGNPGVSAAELVRTRCERKPPERIGRRLRQGQTKE
jgi:hypothetical protein